MCSNTDIKEMLPAYLEQRLEEEWALRVEKHLETCDDCRAEIKLLGMMISEQVPDPGEAFWAAMPERIYRNVQKMEEKKRLRLIDISSLWNRMLLPRWAWSVTAAALVLVVTLLIVKPLPKDVSTITPNGDDAAYDESTVMDTPGLTEFSQTELDDVSRWADNELASLGNEIVDVFISAPERDIHEDLSDLNRQEIEHLSRRLEELEQEG
ncbi:MAG TPA: zf-HC2 domain-containing protein [Nitrospirota bacterium]|nr:zf-HC2 domain-containing protein [Nitrospirota bacterium]